MTRPWKSIATAAVLGITLAACAGHDEEMMQSEASLYERLGGYDAISAVVDDFTARVAADNRLNGDFANTDIPRFKQLLTLQVCQAAGGPCTYIGRDMVASHKGMNITEAEFNWTGEHLAETLMAFNVPDKEQNELMTAIGSMAPDIIGK